MSTATKSRNARTSRGSVLFASSNGETSTVKYSSETRDGNEVLIVTGVPVFRSGTFRDSWGDEDTWEDLHLRQLVDNFNHLQSSGIFPDVPVRDGHPGFLSSGGARGDGKVIGYHTALRTEERVANHNGKSYTYLIADYEILDSTAQVEIRSGLFRSLSSEIGSYLSNDGAEYWPVYMGVAYVDIPAVEGLKGFSKEPSENTRYIFEEESMTINMPETQATPETPATPAPPAIPAAPAVEGAGEAGAARETFVFSMAGNQTSDFAAVQRYVTDLEGEVESLRAFRNETIESGRENFVRELASSNKILASQIDATVAFAKGMTDEQFSAWKEIQSGAPVISVLQNFSSGATGEPFTPGQVDETADRIATLRETIKQHSRANMSPEQIRATKSYGELMALDPTFTL